MKKVKLGEFLLSESLIDESQLKEALERQQLVRKKLGTILVEMGAIDEADMLTALAKKLSYKYTDAPLTLLEESTKELVSESFIRDRNILPLFIKNGFLYVATSDPLDFVGLEDLTAITGFSTLPIVSPTSKIHQAINTIFNYVEETEESEESVSSKELELMERVDSAPIVKLVNQLVQNAFMENASDVHIEPELNSTRIRYRVDGILSEKTILKKDIHDLVITRIKIIAGMNIAEKRNPQDGSFRMNIEGVALDLRVSSIPTPLGEKIVLRLLGADRNITYKLDKIGLSPEIEKILREIVQIPNGIILLTGPTGSGKTTTLYAMLNEIATVEKSVVTVEDPVEKQFEGITQVQINQRAGLTFAAGLRSILRQDPDVIMLGEIRDSETASIAIRAAITGHIVLSTLHTNDAISSISRLKDMGVEAYLVASSIKVVIAQRLVRKLCPYCKITRETTLKERLLLKDERLKKVCDVQGCEKCNNTGYAGRTAVFEIVFIDEMIQQMIVDNVPSKEMKLYAAKNGAIFLMDDALKLVKNGVTSIQEATKILYSVEFME